MRYEREPKDLDVGMIRAMTEWLRTPCGTMVLRPIQARALLELALYGGLFCSARVGAGKTLISALAATVTGAKRPVLAVPANLVEKTKREFKEIARHWRITAPKVVSYSLLGHKRHAEWLWNYRPDLVVCDEVHKLKRVRSAAVARRFARFLHEYPDTIFAGLSGTPVRRSIKDVAHILAWALRARSPMPSDPDVVAEWALLLDDEDERVAAQVWTRPDYSILWQWIGEVHTKEQAREAFGRTLAWTPGVVLSSAAYDEVGLAIEPLYIDPPAGLDLTWNDLRTLWVMPDDWPLADKTFGVWAASQQLALGFYYRHDPRPPEDWMTARREWCSFSRRVLEESTTLDTETQVRDACLRGDLPSHAWDAWDRIRDRFVPNTVPVWLSDHAIKAVARWGRDGGIVWTSHTAFAEALSEFTGWPYYGELGQDSEGRFIEQATAGTIIASTASNTEGRNLQTGCGPDGRGYCRNLFCSPPKASLDWEQRVGRTFRDGQTRDVTVTYLVGCLENWVALPAAIGYSDFTRAVLTQETLLSKAAISLPADEWLVGPAFGETVQ